MKKRFLAQWLLGASLGAIFLGTAVPAQAQNPAQVLSIQELAHELKTPESIAQYLWRHFSFENDRRQFGKTEYWQSPEEFLKTRKGDCEDFSILAHALLKTLGFRAYILNVYGSGFAHTVCVFEEGGRLSVIDGDRVLRYRAKTLEEVSQRLHSHWKASAVVAPSVKSKRGTIVHLIQRIEGERQLAFSA